MQLYIYAEDKLIYYTKTHRNSSDDASTLCNRYNNKHFELFRNERQQIFIKQNAYRMLTSEMQMFWNAHRLSNKTMVIL